MFPNLNEGKNCKILLGILIQMLTNSQCEFKCDFLCLLNLYIDIETKYIPNMKNCLVYGWNQKKTRQRINSVHWSKGIYLCVYLYLIIKICFLRAKDRACLRIAIPAYCFNISGSIFGVLFCLLIKKLILGCKTI